VRSFAIPPPDDDVLDPAHDKHLESIFTQNAAWRQEKLSEDAAFFEKLGSGHKPRWGDPAASRRHIFFAKELATERRLSI
jgi:hypothetical protein